MGSIVFALVALIGFGCIVWAVFTSPHKQAASPAKLPPVLDRLINRR